MSGVFEREVNTLKKMKSGKRDALDLKVSSKWRKSWLFSAYLEIWKVPERRATAELLIRFPPLQSIRWSIRVISWSDYKPAITV